MKTAIKSLMKTATSIVNNHLTQAVRDRIEKDRARHAEEERRLKEYQAQCIALQDSKVHAVNRLKNLDNTRKACESKLQSLQAKRAAHLDTWASTGDTVSFFTVRNLAEIRTDMNSLRAFLETDYPEVEPVLQEDLKKAEAELAAFEAKGYS